MLENQKLISFLEEKANGTYIRSNEFLKSLYPLPKGNEPAKWNSQQEMKIMKNWLQKMVADGLITVKAGRHNDLGRPFYEGVQQKQRFYNLQTLILEIKLGVDESDK